ncbi:MAG: hypothetical protein NC250_02930 [Alistipes senegalensis]|nr:hypothetical protein [Bacteroides cellulosilyticus]MCM1351673.1 hypothetical protein [Alistipes senegalensis]
MKGFTIEIASRFEGWWRYNAALTCGCFDAAGERIGYVSAESHVADVGAGLAERPAEIAPDRRLTLETPPCDHAVLYIYVIPHALPESNDIDATKPFGLDLRIDCDGRRIRSERLQINQWSGISLELRLDRADAQSR